jgi:hypothetical protein
VYYISISILKDFFPKGLENFPCVVWDKLNYFDFARLGGTISHIRKESILSKEELFSNSRDQFPCFVFECEEDNNAYACLFDIVIFINSLIIFPKFKTIAHLSSRAKKLQKSIKTFAETLEINEKQKSTIDSISSVDDNNNSNDNNKNTQAENTQEQNVNPEVTERKRKRTKDKEVKKKLFFFISFFIFIFWNRLQEGFWKKKLQHIKTSFVRQNGV